MRLAGTGQGSWQILWAIEQRESSGRDRRDIVDSRMKSPLTSLWWRIAVLLLTVCCRSCCSVLRYAGVAAQRRQGGCRLFPFMVP